MKESDFQYRGEFIINRDPLRWLMVAGDVDDLGLNVVGLDQ